MDIKYAIFDMDGTLLDSMLVWNNLIKEYLTVNNKRIPEDFDSMIDTLRTYSTIQLAEYLKKRFEINDPPEKVLSDMSDIILINYRENIGPKADVKDYLYYLKSKGVKMCIATNTHLNLAQPGIEHNDMMQFFSKIYCDEDYGMLKSNPEFYELVAKMEGFDLSETAIFEDSLYAVQSARKTSCKYVIGIYDSVSKNQAEEIKSIADYYITEYKELMI